MNQTKSKIFGLLIFIIIVTILFYVALKPTQNEEKKIKSISLTGNDLLPYSSYLNFAKLSETNNSTMVTLPILKARLEKHPFVAVTEVEVSESYNAKIYLKEKKVLAILMYNDQAMLLTDELQLVPLLSNMKTADLPIISNSKNANHYKVLEFLQSAEIVEASNILNAIKFTNEEMFKNLSEVNLNGGDGITLIFSNIHPIIKFGTSEISKKILILNSIWNQMKYDNDLSQSDYVDLRFENQIYLGKAEETQI